MSEERGSDLHINKVMVKVDYFLPDNLIKKLESRIPRSLDYRSDQDQLGSSMFNDPIMNDLMKLNPPKNDIRTEKDYVIPESINDYSSRLNEMLYLLNEKSDIDDNIRISIENNLFELTSYIPKSSLLGFNEPALIYPNETLSKIIVDNYRQLLSFSSSYFNLSLASHITKYLVELIYSLNYWEVYHLLYLVPDLDYYLKLINFEIFQTSFGPIVRPPENYLNDSMLSGLQYPFPYPFYNYSYHSFNTDANKSKYQRIEITPYIDITLKNTEYFGRKRRKTVYDDIESKKSTSEIENKIENDFSNSSEDDSDDSDGKISEYDIDDADSNIDVKRSDRNSMKMNELKILQHGHKSKDSNSELLPDDKKNKQKSGVIHQCHLVDPSTLRTCLKIFYGKNELLRHQEFVHATKKKIYKCIYCSRNGSKVQSYPRHDSLARHIRRKHGVTGKENKMAVNYAKENVEIIEEPSQVVNEHQKTGKPLPHPQFLNPDFTMKSSYAGFSSFSSKGSIKHENAYIERDSRIETNQGTNEKDSQIINDGVNINQYSNSKNHVVNVVDLPEIHDEVIEKKNKEYTSSCTNGNLDEIMDSKDNAIKDKEKLDEQFTEKEHSQKDHDLVLRKEEQKSKTKIDEQEQKKLEKVKHEKLLQEEHRQQQEQLHRQQQQHLQQQHLQPQAFYHPQQSPQPNLQQLHRHQPISFGFQPHLAAHQPIFHQAHLHPLPGPPLTQATPGFGKHAISPISQHASMPIGLQNSPNMSTPMHPFTLTMNPSMKPLGMNKPDNQPFIRDTFQKFRIDQSMTPQKSIPIPQGSPPSQQPLLVNTFNPTQYRVQKLQVPGQRQHLPTSNQPSQSPDNSKSYGGTESTSGS